MKIASIDRLRNVAQRPTILIAALLLLNGCGGEETPPEAQLRTWVARAVEATENKQRDTLIEMISPGYSDARNNERDDINTKLRGYFMRQQNIELLTSIDEIRLFDDTAAEIEISLGSTGTNDSALGFSANAYRLFLQVEYDGGDWQLLSARWGRMGDPLQ